MTIKTGELENTAESAGSDSKRLVRSDPALEGELIRPSEWREADDRYGVGDFVTRDGTDVHKVLSLNGPAADGGDFLCAKAPEPYGDGQPWTQVGEVEFNLTRRYSPVEYRET